jgi:RimJ/RimL family protein N-acetyltransferase
MMQPWQQPATGPTAAIAAGIAALVPRIVTERFRLRAPQIGDFPVYARFMIDDQDVSAAPEAEAEAAWLDFCQLVASWPLRGFGPWTIEPRTGGEALGAIVLNHEFGDPEVEIGWVLAHGAEGQGIATEAARAACAHAFGQMGFATLVSYIDADNARSIAVAERLGAQRDPAAEARVISHNCLVFRHAATRGSQ